MNVCLSVIVPVYNIAPYVRRCIESLLCQSFSDFELLIIDDGSTDGSAAICDEYAGKEKCIRVIHQINAGVTAARRRGVEEAKVIGYALLMVTIFYPKMLFVIYMGILLMLILLLDGYI